MLTEKIKSTIELLKSEDINGCITGSSMLDSDFDQWESVPDIDVFVYTDMQLLYVADMLMFKHGFELCTAGEEWKFNRVINRGFQQNAALTTMKVQRDGVTVNVTYKKNKNNIMSVLASFDQSCIMIGYDLKFKWGIDMRTKDIRIFDDRDHKWSDDPSVSVPNPMREQDVDMYGAEMWIRQWDRVIKYWNRGIDTRPMARFYIELVDGVIAKGQLFRSEKSEEAYREFNNLYVPLREKMQSWYDDKKDI